MIFKMDYLLRSTFNFKHIDCNGDGVIDANDITAII